MCRTFGGCSAQRSHESPTVEVISLGDSSDEEKKAAAVGCSGRYNFVLRTFRAVVWL